MAMTVEEKKKSRAEASKRWYEAHKKAVGVMNKNTKRLKINFADDIRKHADKLIKKNIKTVNLMKEMVKEAASIMSDAYKTRDDLFIAAIIKKFKKELMLEIGNLETDIDGNTKKTISFTQGAKTFRVPTMKNIPTQKADIIENPTDDNTNDETNDNNLVEIPVDPNKLKDIEAGAIIEDDISGNDFQDNDVLNDDADLDNEDDEDSDEDTEDEDEDEDEELSDEEWEAKRRRRLERSDHDFEEDYMNGRAEMLREMDSMGYGDDF